MKNKITIVLSMIVLIGLSTTSFAEVRHPRRAEVNHHLKNQTARVDRKVANGDMSNKEANKLHEDDHEIKQEEKDMASQNGGHITKQEQTTLNQQENKVSTQITNH